MYLANMAFQTAFETGLADRAAPSAVFIVGTAQ